MFKATRMSKQRDFNPLFQLTVEEFIDLQRSLIREELHSIRSESSSEEGNKLYLNFAQAAKYLNISKPTFSKLRKEGYFNPIQVSAGRILFSRLDLDSYLQKNKRPLK